MAIHVLPGDATVGQFRAAGIDGDVVVCRECLVDGPRSVVPDDDFFKARAAFVVEAYGAGEGAYEKEVAAEFARLRESSAGEVNFWFEHELFCQANFWFCLAMTERSGGEFYRVAPKIGADGDIWRGFAAGPDVLRECFARRVRLSIDDVELGARLWRAFAGRDGDELLRLGETVSEAFPYLRETTRAAAEIETRPREVVREIVASGKTELKDIFPEFSKRLGVYGFGDAQVARLLTSV